MRTGVAQVRSGRAFTLVELQVALVVTGIILAAVVSLGYALNAAQRATENLGREQAALRYADARIRQLIQSCNAVVAASASAVQLWRDDNEDGEPNEPEESYILQQSGDGTAVQLVTVDRATQAGWGAGVVSTTPWFTIVKWGGAGSFSVHSITAADGFTLNGDAWIDEDTDGLYDDSELFSVTVTDLVAGCDAGSIQWVMDVVPTGTRFVAVQFDLTDSRGETNTYQVAGRLWCGYGHVQ